MLNRCHLTAKEVEALIMEDEFGGDTQPHNEIERYTYRIPGQAIAYSSGCNKGKPKQ